MIFLFGYLQIKAFEGSGSHHTSFHLCQLHSSSEFEGSWNNFYPETNMPDPFMNEKPKTATGRLSTNVFIYNCLFEKISSSAISINAQNYKSLILSSTFKECSANSGGAGIRFLTGDLVISRCFSTSCSADDGKYCLFAYIKGKADKSNIKIDQVTTFGDGQNNTIKSAKGGIYITQSKSAHVKNVNQTYNKGNLGVTLYIQETSDNNISFSNFASNFAYSSILEINSNAIMEFCNLVNNYIHRYLKNAAIRIYNNEFKISYCNLLQIDGDNLCYQTFASASFVVSNCCIPDSNLWVRNEIRGFINANLPANKYILFSFDFIQENQAYSENQNRETPAETFSVTPAVTPIGTPIGTPAGTFNVIRVKNFGLRTKKANPSTKLTNYLFVSFICAYGKHPN